MQTEFEGKKVWVIGAGRGIGKDVAEVFGRKGAHVAVSARSTGEIQQVAAAIGGGAHAVPCDVADPASVRDAFATVEKSLGHVDILINSAGISLSAPIHKMPLEDWDRMMHVNLRGAFLLTQCVLPGMYERGWGRVIHLASIAGKSGMEYVAGYCATKHGLMGMIRATALEVAQKGVTINAVCPGYVDSPMTDGNITRLAKRTGHPEEAIRGAMEGLSPQKRLFSTSEIAETTLYLARESARGINGQGINICGGSVFA